MKTSRHKCLSPGHLESFCKNGSSPPKPNLIPPEIQGREGILGKPPNYLPSTVSSIVVPLETGPHLNTTHTTGHIILNLPTKSNSGVLSKIAAEVPAETTVPVDPNLPKPAIKLQ